MDGWVDGWRSVKAGCAPNLDCGATSSAASSEQWAAAFPHVISPSFSNIRRRSRKGILFSLQKEKIGGD
ncbi:hypothetical protein GJAV_G00182920 [Gymnothorax javanicus]|nr:hypothetical protein GJAV_G00182920 [Gymnothorax javanicus]